jgi:hypothetical protein
MQLRHSQPPPSSGKRVSSAQYGQYSTDCRVAWEVSAMAGLLSALSHGWRAFGHLWSETYDSSPDGRAFGRLWLETYGLGSCRLVNSNAHVSTSSSARATHWANRSPSRRCST